MTQWQDYTHLGNLWNVLSNVRNTMDHAGHQKDAMKLEKIVRNMEEKVMPMVQQVADQWLGMTAPDK